MTRISTLIAAAAFATLGFAANAAIDPTAATDAAAIDAAGTTTLAKEDGSRCTASRKAGPDANTNFCARMALRAR